MGFTIHENETQISSDALMCKGITLYQLVSVFIKRNQHRAWYLFIIHANW